MESLQPTVVGVRKSVQCAGYRKVEVTSSVSSQALKSATYMFGCHFVHYVI